MKFFFEEFNKYRRNSSPLSKMTARNQKRKAVEELVSQDIETLIGENNQTENLVAGPSKSPRVHSENIDETKTSLKK